MKRRDWFLLLFLICFYLVNLVIRKPDIFTFKFDKNLINRYFLSQDIPHEVPGKRLFLSDADVDLATGYLYAQGKDPALYNFEHMPLIKYLYGFSVVLFNNPYLVTISFGILLIILFYYFVKKNFNNLYVPFLACTLLILDPLFIDATSSTLFDLGQTLTMLLYLISVLYFKNNFIFQGITLGLFAATKFWVTPIFFVAILFLYKIYKKDFDLKKFVYHLIISFLVFAIPYTQSFILTDGRFNLIWHVLKIFKYRFQHNVSSFFGASVILFITGYLKTWWGNKQIAQAQIWSALWPLSLAISLYIGLRNFKLRKINNEFIMTIIPILYLFYLGVQAPFPRYFLIILPFLYMLTANQICVFLKKFKIFKLISS